MDDLRLSCSDASPKKGDYSGRRSIVVASFLHHKTYRWSNKNILSISWHITRTLHVLNVNVVLESMSREIYKQCAYITAVFAIKFDSIFFGLRSDRNIYFSCDQFCKQFYICVRDWIYKFFEHMCKTNIHSIYNDKKIYHDLFMRLMHVFDRSILKSLLYGWFTKFTDECSNDAIDIGDILTLFQNGYHRSVSRLCHYLVTHEGPGIITIKPSKMHALLILQ